MMIFNNLLRANYSEIEEKIKPWLLLYFQIDSYPACLKQGKNPQKNSRYLQYLHTWEVKKMKDKIMKDWAALTMDFGGPGSCNVKCHGECDAACNGNATQQQNHSTAENEYRRNAMPTEYIEDINNLFT
jgi:hypothetical protein